MQERRCRAGLLVYAFGLVALGSTLMAAAPADVHVGVTRPNEERKLSFSYPGVVREVLVKKGDRVKAGQALLKLDCRLDENQLAQQEIEANSVLKVEYAAKSAKLKAVRYERVQELAKSDAASPLELEQTQLDAELASTQHKLSYEEQQTAKLKAEGYRIKVELAQLTSTIDGIVQDISIREGEYADPQQSSQRAAAVVVEINPLKVEVFLPTPVAASLKKGQELEVAYPNDNTWHKAQIEFLDPVADAGSGTRKLELKMPNPEGREPGWQVSVRVPGQQ